MGQFQLLSDERDELRQATLRLARLALEALENILDSPYHSAPATVRAAELVLKGAGVIVTERRGGDEGEVIEASSIVVSRQLPTAD